MHNFYRLRLAGVLNVILVTFLSVVVLAANSQAEAVQISWPWSAGQYTVHSSTPISSVGPSWCQSLVFQQRNVAGLEGVKNMCMSSNGSTHFGLYGELAGFEAAISFGDDDKLHRIINICKSSDECLYLAGTDMLVRKEFISGSAYPNLVVYKNFTQRLSARLNPINLANEYHFDSSGSKYTKYIFESDTTGRAWSIGGLGASTNGRWLAVEFRGAGIGLLNTETLQMKRISSASFTYSAGYHHFTEFAVSNDGAHVARMGFDSGLLIIDTDSTCGDIPTNDNMDNSTSVINTCKTARNYYGFITDFKNGLLPKFSEDGGQLEFTATSSSVVPHQVVLDAFNYFYPRLDYLALGDSYSSGEGETDDDKYIIGTNIEHEKCHTSTRSYPFVLSEKIGINNNLMKSVACCAARTVDVVGKSDSYMGQGDRLGASHLDLGNVDLLLAKTKALSDFLPGRILQSDFVSEYTPKAITVGIGGNDAGFMEKLIACLSPTTCKWAGTAKGKEQTAIEIKNLFSTMVDTYTQVHDKSPNSKIYAIGYPKIINETGECGGLVGLLFDRAEREFIVESILYLNQVIEAAAGAAGVKYIDIYDSFGDHTLCGMDKVGAINAVMLGDDLGPLDNFKWLRFIGQESFHPNPLGHALTAAKIIEQTSNILTYNHCKDKIICPNGQSVPEPTTALLPSGYNDYPAQKNVNFVSLKKPVVSRVARMSKDSGVFEYIIAMPNNSFKPNTTIAFEVDNEPSLRRVLTVSNTGSLDAEVKVPNDLNELYLVLHLVGDSFSGQSVDYYQTVRYFMPDYVAGEEGNDSSLFDIIVPIYMPIAPSTKTPISPSTGSSEDGSPISPPTGSSEDGLPTTPPDDKPIIVASVEQSNLSTNLHDELVDRTDFALEAEPLISADEITTQASIYQNVATKELAIATSNPEVKGTSIIAKSVVKSSAKGNNFLRDWLIPRLGYGLLAAAIFALIIIRVKKMRKPKE